MNFNAALTCAGNGSHIRRANWLNPLRWNGRALEFVKAVKTDAARLDRSYRPTGKDLCARDWEVADAQP